MGLYGTSGWDFIVCLPWSKPSYLLNPLKEKFTCRNIRHLHLHVLSGDLCSERLKNKKHYNSFHPGLGFFLHVDDVLSWFDAESSYFQNVG